jgi:hypothetical protein
VGVTWIQSEDKELEELQQDQLAGGRLLLKVLDDNKEGSVSL